MDAQELRIGNWIDFKGSNEKFERHSFVDGNVLRNIKPILLTEEWLVKFGFKQGKFGWSIPIYDQTLWVRLDGFVAIAHDFEFCEIRHFKKYVHQLQNLVFALTNKELTLK